MNNVIDNNHNKTCPVELAGSLDNSIRRFLQKPQKLLAPYIKKGMTVLDLGCGPGFFTVEIAALLQGSGKVIAADLQQGMLEKVSEKIRGTEIEQRIELHKCENTKIGITEKVDFIMAIYMVHEVPNQKVLFEELKSILVEGGKIYIIEPKFHVSNKNFDNMIGILEKQGYKVIDKPKVFFSRAVVLTN